MSFRFSFGSVNSRAELLDLMDFLTLQDLEYPRYEEWLQRTEVEIIEDYKKTILAYSDGKLVGDLIYQPHKSNPHILELKNLRIHPDMRERGFARFMDSQVEVEAKDQGFQVIMCDLRSDQVRLKRLMESLRYTTIRKVCLYDQHHEDIVMAKPLQEKSKIIFPNLQDYSSR